MELAGAILLLWFASGIAGACAGMRRNAEVPGFALGILLGPVGVIAALGLDQRPQCPRCAARLDGRGKICQHCQSPLLWTDWGGPKLAEEEVFTPIAEPPQPEPEAPEPKEIRAKAEPIGGWG